MIVVIYKLLFNNLRNMEDSKRHQTLPRHTVLAKLSRRTGAFIIDLALTLAFTLVLYFAASRPAFKKSINETYQVLYTYDFRSHLFDYDEAKHQRVAYKSDTPSETYLNVLSYYYLSYLTGENIEVPEGYTGDFELLKAPNYKEYVPDTQTLPKDYYTVEWFNKNVLEINDNADPERNTSYFEYAKTDDVVDKAKIGVPRAEHFSTKANANVPVTETELSNVLYERYEIAYFDNLVKQSFYAPYYEKVELLTGISWLIPMVFAVLISYLFVPLFTANHASLGKKFFKLGLCDLDGYKMAKWQLILRAVPCVVTLVGMFLIPLSNYYIALIVGGVIFMVSLALAVASPKHASLHDYASRTIVIDTEASIIFDNPNEEDEFLAGEDNLINEKD